MIHQIGSFDGIHLQECRKLYRKRRKCLLLASPISKCFLQLSEHQPGQKSWDCLAIAESLHRKCVMKSIHKIWKLTGSFFNDQMQHLETRSNDRLLIIWSWFTHEILLAKCTRVWWSNAALCRDRNAKGQMTDSITWFWSIQERRIYSELATHGCRYCLPNLTLVIGVCQLSLTHYQTTNFKLFRTERVCRRQFQIWWKWQKLIQTGRKHCGKRRNCTLLAISPFPTVFQKACFPGASKGVIVWEWVKNKVI